MPALRPDDRQRSLLAGAAEKAYRRGVEPHTDFDAFLAQAWADHAEAAPAVAQRLGDGAALVRDEAQLSRLADLAHHVYGAHLGAWRDGSAFMSQLAALPVCARGGASGQALRRCLASLALCDRGDANLASLTPSDQVRAVAMAATNLAEHDAQRAARMLRDALARAEHAALPGADPMHRQLAVAGNNIACALEDKPLRSADERALMILAAQTARRCWALAGSWLETERAEYRLALTWLAAGEPARARGHAQACLSIVAANDGAALERLFAWEALGRVERAAGNADGHAHALAQAREALAQVDEADRAWCADSIAQLAA